LEIEAVWSNAVEKRTLMGQSVIDMAGKKILDQLRFTGPRLSQIPQLTSPTARKKRIKLEAMGKRKVGALEKVEADL
jgi:hypothetical protein